MKLRTVLILAPLVLGAGYLTGAHLSGGAWPTLGLPLGGTLGALRRTTLQFWEDIQFKDFAHAATYHDAAAQSEVDIPYLLERLFLQKPESLDFINFEILFADLDSTGLRARVKTRVTVKNLLDNKVYDREIMLYYHRASLGDPWAMELESSLRRTEADENKKH